MVASIQAVAHHDVALSVRDLTVNLPKGMERIHAVENISFDLKRGQILCIIGESGSGKSVTANAIMGLLPKVIRVSSGSIQLEGMNIIGMSPDKLRNLRGRVVSMIFQDPLSALNPLMTVGAQIDEVMAAHGFGTPKACRNRAIELLTEVGLPDPELMYHQYPFRLSGGQRQRVMIAMALALEPTVLIADEPTTALDVTTQAQILELIREIQRRKGMSVMFITHDFGVVAEIADSVVVMEKGHIVEQGSADQVLKAPKHPYTQRLIAAVPHLIGEDRPRAEPASKEPILKVEGMVKTYRGGGALFGAQRIVKAVNEVSFELAPGRTLGTGPKEARSTLLTVDEEAVIVAFRRYTLLPQNDCFYALQPTIPHLTPLSLHRCLQRHGVGRLPNVEGDLPARRSSRAIGSATFHIHVAEVRTKQGKQRRFVAIDRTSKVAFMELHEKATTVVSRRVPAPADSGRPL
ncbi:dipeptide transporter; ATP-binding component of ABC superfamily (modular protein) [Mesorhizobium sp. STM 4661]|nr:dipeptide transporter; ATP-binding component of ABC superfamily (modular protein) [Mesorhizobium sp. STM 4661]